MIKNQIFKMIMVALFATIIVTPVYGFTPNDPLFNQQYGLTMTNIDDMWNYRRDGNNVILCIIDSGISRTHSDLSDNYENNYSYDFIDGGNPDDQNGHGTQVSGIAAAGLNNGIGVAGVGNIEIRMIRVLDAQNLLEKTSDVTGAIGKCQDNIGSARVVINLSLQMANDPDTQVVINAAYANGHFIVASSGNGNTNQVVFPARYDNVFAVGAVDQNKNRWVEGSQGSNYGPDLDLVAPGVDIYSTTMDGGWNNDATGTSFAAPFVSAVVALFISKNPNILNSVIVAALKNNADSSFSGYNQNKYGAGILDAMESWRWLFIPLPPPPCPFPPNCIQSSIPEE